VGSGFLAAVLLILPGDAAPLQAAPAATPTPVSPADPASYDITPRGMTWLTPGLVIDKGPPKGWSHLIIKVTPRLNSGDVNKLSDSTRQTAEAFFIALLADVQPHKGQGNEVHYELDKLAAGTGYPIGGQDTIITSGTQRKLGANLGFVGRSLLERNEERVQKVHVTIRSTTMAVIDVPGFVYKDGAHLSVVRRYAVLVDPKTGRLETFVWFLERDERGGGKAALGQMQLLPPNKFDECDIHVDGRFFSVFGVPTEEAFAMVRPPKGRQQVPFTMELARLAIETNPTASQAASLDAALRTELASALARED
jgi:hypothetical protein